MTKIANDNSPVLFPSIDLAVTGQAITINQHHRRFGRCYAEFVGHTGNGRDVLVRKLISSQWKARWTKPMKVARAQIISVHCNMARG